MNFCWKNSKILNLGFSVLRWYKAFSNSLLIVLLKIMKLLTDRACIWLRVFLRLIDKAIKLKFIILMKVVLPHFYINLVKKRMKRQKVRLMIQILIREHAKNNKYWWKGRLLSMRSRMIHKIWIICKKEVKMMI